MGMDLLIVNSDVFFEINHGDNDLVGTEICPRLLDVSLALAFPGCRKRLHSFSAFSVSALRPHPSESQSGCEA